MNPATITAAIAVAAIVSPIITALINNHYQVKLRKLDYVDEQLKNTVYHKRDIFEKYLHYSGRLLYTGSPDDYMLYYSYYFQALLYVDDELAYDMQDAHRLFDKMDRGDELQLLLFGISSEIKKLIASMPPIGSSKRTIMHK